MLLIGALLTLLVALNVVIAWKLRGKFISLEKSNDIKYRNQLTYLDLTRSLGVEYPLPLPGGWAASPDFLQLIVLRILAQKPRNIIECGSGISTVLTGYALRKLGGQRKIIALEQNKNYSVESAKMVQLHGLDEFVEIVYAPLSDHKIENETYKWYELEFLKKIQSVDLMIVDGPVNSETFLARYPAIILLKELFKGNVTILLDDYHRPQEQNTVKKWMSELPSCYLEEIDSEKGAAILTIKEEEV